MRENTAMIPDAFQDSIIGAAGGLAAAAGALALVAKRALKAFGEARTEHSADGARTELLDALRTELARMGEQNGRLADSLNRLQIEVISLRSENADLHATVRSLHAEVTSLRQHGASSGFGPLQG